MFGERLEHVDHNSWTFHETTSAEYCPYCHSFDCCGDCWEAEDYQWDLHSDMEVQWKLMEWMLLEEENPENYELLIEF